MSKSDRAFRTISEVSKELDIPAHVLRFWETKFPQIKPMKRGGGRRYYRPEDIALLRGVSEMLYVDGFSIKGVQKALKDHGVKVVVERADGQPVEPLARTPETAEAQDAPAVVDAAPAAAGGDDRMTALRDALRALETLREDLFEKGRDAA